MLVDRKGRQRGETERDRGKGASPSLSPSNHEIEMREHRDAQAAHHRPPSLSFTRSVFRTEPFKGRTCIEPLFLGGGRGVGGSHPREVLGGKIFTGTGTGRHGNMACTDDVPRELRETPISLLSAQEAVDQSKLSFLIFFFLGC